MQAQAIVILGGGGQRRYAPEYGGPAADPLLLERLAYGAYVAHQTGLPILVSGNGIEARAMRDTLVRNFGIEPRWVEDRAYDTFDNASNSAQLLRADGVQTHRPGDQRRPPMAGVARIRRHRPAGDARARRACGPTAISVCCASCPTHRRWCAPTMAIYELLGEPVRELLALSHLRRH